MTSLCSMATLRKLSAIHRSDCRGTALNIFDGETAADFFCGDFYIGWLCVDGVTIRNRTRLVGADHQPFQATPYQYKVSNLSAFESAMRLSNRPQLLFDSARIVA